MTLSAKIQIFPVIFNIISHLVVPAQRVYRSKGSILQSHSSDDSGPNEDSSMVRQIME